VDAEGSGDFAHGFPFLEQPLGQLPLIFVHLLGPSESDAAFLGVRPARAGTLADEVALEFGDSGEDGHDHFARVGRGIGPGFRDGLEAGTGEADRLDNLKQIAGGARQPVEFPDGDDVAVTQLRT